LDLEAADGNWKEIGAGLTDTDGRAKDLLPSGFALHGGVYRLVFDTEGYFAAQGVEGFYREVAITFTIRDPAQHYHVPLLLSPFGYSTYRGS
jgi:5-hydroxyisourate hydrolase